VTKKRKTYSPFFLCVCVFTLFWCIDDVICRGASTIVIWREGVLRLYVQRPLRVFVVEVQLFYLFLFFIFTGVLMVCSALESLGGDMDDFTLDESQEMGDLDETHLEQLKLLEEVLWLCWDLCMASGVCQCVCVFFPVCGVWWCGAWGLVVRCVGWCFRRCRKALTVYTPAAILSCVYDLRCALRLKSVPVCALCVCACVRACVRACVYMYVGVLYVCVCINVYVYVYVYMCPCMYVCVSRAVSLCVGVGDASCTRCMRK